MEFENKQKINLNRRIFYMLAILTLLIPILLGFLVSRIFCFCTSDQSDIAFDMWSIPVVKNATGHSSKAKPPTKHGSRAVWDNPRLPPHVVPLHYSVTLYPVFAGNDSEFYGNESLILFVRNATSHILLHSKDLNVTLVALSVNSTGERIGVRKCFLSDQFDYWIVETVKEIPANWFVNLTLTFQGVLTKFRRGFFKKTYTDFRTDTTRFLASTHFEPTHARSAFPCFDEPHLKAEFSISLIHKPVYMALSNMPNQSNSPVQWGSDLVQTRFQRSVKMSTFAVSFTVCDFQLKSSYSFDGKLLRVFSSPDKINQTDYALRLLNSTLAFYTKMLNTSYPLPKLDLIAIPTRFPGNTASWGLISLPDALILYDETQSSPRQRSLVTRGMAHELAHMWFGNFITMHWWDDLWFKEGLSSFLETIACVKIEPDLIELHTSVLSTQETMEKDTNLKINPIVTSVKTRDEINSAFNEVSFQKGGAIFRMLLNFIGEQDFYEAIRLFVKRFQWRTATTNDLWKAFNDVVKSLDIIEIMKTWVNQPGFPVINVNYDYSDPVDPRLDIRQSRFRSDFTMDSNDTADTSQTQYKWFVPLDYITSSLKMLTVHWMNKTDTQIQLKQPLPSWIKFNVNRSGYYRVNYPTEIWQYFSENFQRGNYQELSPLDRSGLLDDAIALASSDYLDYSVAFNMTLYLDKERDYMPWKTISGLLYRTKRRLRADKAYSIWRKYVLSKIMPILSDLGWEIQGRSSEQLLHNLLINLACEYEAEPCLQMASEKFKAWIKSNKSIDYDLKSVVYNYGMHHAGTAEDWDIMWERYTREANTHEQGLLLFGLSQTKSQWLFQRFIWFALDEHKVKSEAFIDIIEALSFNPVGNCWAWEWIRENPQYIIQRFDLSKLEYLVYSMAKFFNTEFQLNQVFEMFQRFPDSKDSLNYRSLAIEEVQKNLLWMKTSKPKLIAWLNKYHNF